MFDTEAYFDSLDMFGIRLGLDAARDLHKRAGYPGKELCFIHLAGTNGKGSTGAMLERCFRSAGLRTGFYTSPHLINIRERFRINGIAVSEEEFNMRGEFLCRCSSGGRFSYFEFATILAMVIFAEAKVDVVIWETGMGGRLDATNIVTPVASVITNIALDHQAHLGSTAALIAAEKAGIIKHGIPLFHGVLPADAEEVISHRASELSSPVYPVRLPVPELCVFENSCQVFEYSGRKISLSLPGKMQRENFRIAFEVLEYFSGKWGFSLEKALEGMSQVRWPARFQHLDGMIIDGGHNPDGVRALYEAVSESYPGERFTVVYAAFGDKHAPECLKYLEKIASRFIFTLPGTGGRAAYAPEELCGMTQIPSSAQGDPLAALADARLQAGANERIIVSGSLYLAGAALEKFASPESVLNI